MFWKFSLPLLIPLKVPIEYRLLMNPKKLFFFLTCFWNQVTISLICPLNFQTWKTFARDRPSMSI